MIWINYTFNKNGLKVAKHLEHTLKLGQTSLYKQ